MAWSLSKLPEWTNWTILIALAVYDLFAVLSPCGPLKALVEMSQSRNEAIPGLVYEADAPESRAPPASHAPAESERDDHALQASASADAEPPCAGDSDVLADAGPRLRGRVGSSGGEGGAVEMQQVVQPDASAAGGDARDDDDDLEHGHGGGDEEQDGGVKLGLGDFVFYSVLVARCGAFAPFYGAILRHACGRAASTNMTVVVTTFGAIIFGLCSTLVLLNIVRRCVLSSSQTPHFSTPFCSIKKRFRPCPFPFSWACSCILPPCSRSHL
jgi:presenilin 1